VVEHLLNVPKIPGSIPSTIKTKTQKASNSLLFLHRFSHLYFFNWPFVVNECFLDCCKPLANFHSYEKS
jgi:hypothetical protein